jgi:hypothetical protein
VDAEAGRAAAAAGDAREAHNDARQAREETAAVRTELAELRREHAGEIKGLGETLETAKSETRQQATELAVAQAVSGLALPAMTDVDSGCRPAASCSP